MAKKIIEIKEVKYYPDAEVNCSCGAKFKVGSTLPKINVEICSACHPFYTGTQKLIDTSGRVDKFRNRMAKFEEMASKKAAKAKVESKNPKVDKKDSKGDK